MRATHRSRPMRGCWRSSRTSASACARTRRRSPLGELQIHARHDPAVRRQLERLDATWTGYLTHLLQAGIWDGALRADLDVQVDRIAGRAF